MHFFVVLLACKSVDRSTFCMRASYKNVSRSTLLNAYKTTKNAFNSYNYIEITPTFNIVEFFVVNFICVRLFAVGNYYAIDYLHLTSS